VTTVLTLPTCPATSQNFVRIFCNDSEALVSHISALCPGGQTFLLQKHLKEFVRKTYSFSENDLKHEITLANNLVRKELKLPSTSEANSLSLEQFFSFIAT